MKICLIGDFSGTPDEGMKNISTSTLALLSERHDILTINSRAILNPLIQFKVKLFKPRIIHYLHGPTIKSLILLRYLKMLLSAAGSPVKTVVTATRPYFSGVSKILTPYFNPDLVLTQSEKFETFFKTCGFPVVFFPNGVDLSKFSPAGKCEKKEIRKRLNLPLNKKIILHVGHIKPNRKLDLFMDIQKMPGVQVVIAGGTHEVADEKLKQQLIGSGIIVIHKYMSDISVLYKASDIYLFPITDKKAGMPETYNQIGAIDLPLSILEAMGCNLPVITSRFGALPRLFEQQNGFVFADDKSQMLDLVRTVPAGSDAGTRQMAASLDWPILITNLEDRYRDLIGITHNGLEIPIHPLQKKLRG